MKLYAVIKGVFTYDRPWQEQVVYGFYESLERAQRDADRFGAQLFELDAVKHTKVWNKE